MFILKKLKNHDTFNYEQYTSEYNNFLNYGKTVSDFMSKIHTPINKEQTIKLTEKLKEFENIYFPEDNEEILYVNPKKPSEMITSKNIDNRLYLCLVYANTSNTYKTEYLCKIEQDTQYNQYYFVDLYKKYLLEKEKFNSLILSGEKNISKEIRISFLLSNTHQCNIKIFKNDIEIGHRLMEFSPFKTFLRLGIFTINGATTVKDDYIGKGYGKLLYNTVDEIFPYQQIPHGYEGSPYGLSDFSEKFWQKRDIYRKTPIVLDYFKDQNENINKLNNCFLNIHKISPYSIYKPYLIEGFFLSQLDNIKITRNKNNETYILNSKNFNIISFNERYQNHIQDIEPEDFREVLINVINIHNDDYKNIDWDDYKLFFENKYPNHSFVTPIEYNKTFEP